MSAKRISAAEASSLAAEDRQERAAHAWEKIQERAAACWREDECAKAGRRWEAALRIAESAFAADDPRLGTSFANAAFARRHRGRAAEAAAMFVRAQSVWAQSRRWLENLRPQDCARSSTHHFRLARRHHLIYRENARRRLAQFAAAAQMRLNALAAGEAPPAAARQWQTEKPSRWGDERKFLAACLLLAPPD